MSARPLYLQIPMAVICNSKLQPLDLQVYGVISWYSKMSKQKCIAANEAIAAILSCNERKIHPKSVSNSVSRLEKAGCVQVLLKPNKKRIEIIPLVKDEPVPEEAQAAEVVPSNDGRTMESDVPLNDGARQEDTFGDPSDDGREAKVDPSNDGTSADYNNPVPLNDGSVFHQMMPVVPSNDGQNSNINKQDMNNKTGTSSGEEAVMVKDNAHEKAKPPSSSRRSKVDTSRDEVLFDILNHWNRERGTKCKSINDIRNNALKRLEEYTVEEIKLAISNIKYDEFWGPRDMQIETFFRFKDRQGEPVNYINRFLNIKLPASQPTPRSRHNFTQELIEQEQRGNQKKEAYGSPISAF